MPASSNDWHARSFESAEWWRAEAQKWIDLAIAAERDGDDVHATNARREAANCRQNARLKEMGETP